MGHFYTSITLVDVEQEPLASFFRQRNRTAVITPCVNGITVVFDAESESQDQEVLTSLAARLSEAFAKPAFAVLNHDDDVLMLWLFTGKKMAAGYNSMTLFYDGEDAHEAIDACAGKLAAAFGAEQSLEKVRAVLKAPAGGADGYILALDRHRALLEALGLPTFSAGFGFNYLGQGAVPGDIDPNKLVRIAGKNKTAKKKKKKGKHPKDMALMEAVIEGSAAKVKALIQAGADVNTGDEFGPAILNAVVNKDSAPGEAAAIVKQLIDAGADVNARGFDGMTALHEAARGGLTDAVRALLDAGAKVDRRGSLGETALDIAEDEEHEEIIKMLEEARPKKKKRKTREQVMLDAILKGKRAALELSQQYTEQAKMLIARKGSLVEVAAAAALILAARTDDLNVLEKAISSGVDVDIFDNATGLTALMTACREGHREVVVRLLDAGAKIDVKTPDGKTALDFAGENSHRDIAALLER